VWSSLDSLASSARDRADGSSDMESTTSLSGASGYTSGNGGDIPGTLKLCTREEQFVSKQIQNNGVEK
jgi:hypothetical protein